tara:strand:+ start:1880 stop:2113 length:234 start_codon:yes stop_codon:yes gene_type:complete
LAAAGVDVAIIKELAGHKSIATTMRYIHVNDRQKRDAISKALGCSHEPKKRKAPQLIKVTELFKATPTGFELKSRNA